jgi:hypothetical protein
LRNQKKLTLRTGNTYRNKTNKAERKKKEEGAQWKEKKKIKHARKASE